MKLKTKDYNIDTVYRDLDLTMPIHPMTGNVSIAQGIKAVNRAVKNIVLSEKWDFHFRPDIYTGVPELLFEQASPVIFAHFEARIKDSIARHEPRVRVDEVVIEQRDPQSVTITIAYEIIAIEMVVETSIILKRDR